MRHRQNRQEAHAGKRLDIQGLRAVAVLAVVANHLTGHPKGGFVGVDVFFVISGFLITGRLLRTAGEVSPLSYIGTFYKLRVRRIVPAALVVIGLTVLASWLLFNGQRAHDIAVDGGWASIFWANWHFAAVGSDYFHALGPVSPLRHYWSLAVEEQFYLVWPLVMFAVAWCAMRFTPHSEDADRRRRARAVAGAVAAVVVCALSLWWGFRETGLHPTSAYYSSLTRAWELGVGALLACLAPLSAVVSARWATLTSWLGIAVVAVAIVVTPDGDGFPLPWALLAVAGSALVVMAGIKAAPLNPILTNPVSVFLGDISYSIYLTHFPLVVFADSLIKHSTGFRDAAVLVGTLGLSIASYYFIEEPFRSWRTGRHPQLWVKGSAAAVAMAAAVVLYAVQPAAPVHYVDINAVSPGGTTSPLTQALVDGLNLTEWPTIANADRIGTTDGLNWRGCGRAGSISASCTFDPVSKDPSKVALVIGDSMSMAYLPMISGALVPRGYQVVGIPMPACTAAFVSITMTDGDADPECDTQHEFYASAVATVKPSLVVMTSAQNTLDRVAATDHDSAYIAGMKKTIGTVEAAGRHVVVLAPPPMMSQLSSCKAVGTSPQDCIATIDDAWTQLHGDDQAAVAGTSVTYIDTHGWFCVDGRCPSVVKGLAVTADGHHLTKEYAQMLVPTFAAALISRHIIG